MAETPDKLSELFKVLPQGAFKDENEFRGYVTDESKLKEFFPLMPQGAFKDETEFLGYFGESLKKKEQAISLQGIASGQSVAQMLGVKSEEPLIQPQPSPSAKPKTYEETMPEDYGS